MTTVFTNMSESDTKFALHSFYFISIIPFVLYFASWVITKYLHKFPLVIISGTIIYCIWSIFVLNKPLENNFRYQDLKILTAAIVNEKPARFNIVDQQTRDNRAMALRYLLTAQGSVPLGVTEYSQANTLYIYSSLPLQNLLKDPVWEIKSFLPYSRLDTKVITESLYLYKLEK